MWNIRVLYGLGVCLLVCFCSCGQPLPESVESADSQVEPESVERLGTPMQLELPLGLPEIVIPQSNPMTEEKVVLGKRLFFDKDLSVDRTTSCASCHDPEQSWGNGSAVGVGIENRMGKRNVPTLLNVAYFRQFFWDGRVGSLEAQVLFPLLHEDEMGMPSNQALLDRVKENPEYHSLFNEAFADGITIINLANAIACFERTLLSGNSPYDRYMAGDPSAMSNAAIRGLEVFMNRGKCNGCHVPPTFIDYSYYNLGVGMDKDDPDLGRYHVFEMNSSKGKFKTPTVRDIARTGPYMHDGSMKTLEEVIELYDQGGIRNRYLSPEVRGRLRLTDQEKKDLITFLVEGLTSDPDDKE